MALVALPARPLGVNKLCACSVVYICKVASFTRVGVPRADTATAQAQPKPSPRPPRMTACRSNQVVIDFKNRQTSEIEPHHSPGLW